MKYNYSDFFVNLIVFVLGGLLADLFFHYVLKVPTFMLIEDLWPMILRCAVFAGALNLYMNLKRVYNLLEGIHEIHEKVKKDIDKKLVKAQPQYRKASINSEHEEIQEGLAT